MKLSGKIKMKLGLCVHTGCFKRATLDVEIPLINYKGQLCDKCFKELEDMVLFNSKEVIK